MEGLPLNEFRILTEKVCTPEGKDENKRTIEFLTAPFNVLNGLEVLGYRVVSSGDFVPSQKKFSKGEYIWTLYRSSTEMEIQ